MNPIGFYLWNSAPWLRAPSRLATLPAGTTRIALSLNAAQINSLVESLPTRRQLRRFIAKASTRNIAIELLLGEPTWVLPAGRASLLEIVNKLRRLPFAALNLDLERSQLPEADQVDWDSNALDTLAAAKEVSPWPLILTTHHRDLAAQDFIHSLWWNGIVAEAVAMIYTSRAERVIEITRPLLYAATQAAQFSTHCPRIAIAQSMEPELDDSESSFSLGQTAALAHWTGIVQELNHEPGFGGIFIQSLETFESAAP